MKPTRRASLFRSSFLGVAVVASCLALASWRSPAQETDKPAASPIATPPTTATAPATPAANAVSSQTASSPGTNSPAAALSTATAPLSAGIPEILKMADAGVSKEILLAFVKASATPYHPGAADVLALKAHHVPDEVTVELLNREAQTQTLLNRARQTVAAPDIVRRLSTGGYIDPDSYEFWWYHYGYPRALSYSYRTLSPYDPLYRRSYWRRGFH